MILVILVLLEMMVKMEKMVIQGLVAHLVYLGPL